LQKLCLYKPNKYRFHAAYKLITLSLGKRWTVTRINFVDAANFYRHTQIVTVYCIHNSLLKSQGGTVRLKKKTKLKSKGTKYYQNTHGKVYRVKPNPKANKRKVLQNRQRKIDAQIKAAQ
jgi:hypothetical protein